MPVEEHDREAEESSTAVPTDASMEEQGVEEDSTAVPPDAGVEQEMEESSTAVPPDTSVEEHEGEESGKWGQFTVEELCQQQGIPVADGLARLEVYGLAADSTTRIRSIADTGSYAPSDVANIILGLELEASEEHD